MGQDKSSTQSFGSIWLYATFDPYGNHRPPWGNAILSLLLGVNFQYKMVIFFIGCDRDQKQVEDRRCGGAAAARIGTKECQLGRFIGGEVIKGESSPLYQGAPFVQVLFPSHLTP